MHAHAPTQTHRFLAHNRLHCFKTPLVLCTAQHQAGFFILKQLANNALNTTAHGLKIMGSARTVKISHGDSGKTRTSDLRFRKPLLCPAELRNQPDIFLKDCSRFWKLLFISLLLLFGSAVYPSQANAHHTCQTLVSEEITVARVLRYDRLETADGRIVQLAGIAVADPSIQIKARNLLEEFTQGKTLILSSLGAHDRWGRLYAHLATLNNESIEATLLAAGLAHTAALTPQACIETFLQHESNARAAHLGLWKNKGYERRTFPIANLLPDKGRHILVKGTIHSTRIIGNRMYINFADPWHQALSLSVSMKDAKTLGLPVAAPAALVGQHIRARGFLEWERHPVIRLSPNDFIALDNRDTRGEQ